MDVFNLHHEARFDPLKHVENVLGRINEGDVTVACWEAGQISPHHLHPNCTEIYLCLEGGGIMRTPEQTVRILPGGFEGTLSGAPAPRQTTPKLIRFRTGAPDFSIANPSLISCSLTCPEIR